MILTVESMWGDVVLGLLLMVGLVVMVVVVLIWRRLAQIGRAMDSLAYLEAPVLSDSIQQLTDEFSRDARVTNDEILEVEKYLEANKEILEKLK